jgi:phage recombination protein Bet
MSANANAVVPSDESKLSSQLAARGVEAHTWNTLKNSCFPGAATASILMAIDYCLARKLDVLKKPCHIVPMQVKQGKDYIWRDVILPGIYEYRITAQRTGLYLGHSKPEYGPLVGPEGFEAPEWCDMTFHRWNEKAKVSVPFPVRVYYREVVGLTKEGGVNSRWSKAPIQMLTKCTEAAGLREAFPDEIGGEPTMEEMIDQIIDQTTNRRATGEPAGMSRTEQAKAALKDRRGEVNPLANLQNTNTERGVPESVIQQGQSAAQQQRVELEPEAADVKHEYNEASALAYLKMQKTVDGLKKAYRQVCDDFEFSGREIPLDIEALYRDLKESLEEREVKQS